MTESVCQHKARKLQQVYSALKNTAPKTREHLKSYLKVFLNINVPDVTVCDGHTNPMDYLWHSYASDFTTNDNPNADCIVWANRGGGKTQLAAIATLLDCLFKPGCKVRILGGSGEQSHRMYDYILSFIQKNFTELVAGKTLKGKTAFLNGSNVEVLTQSAKSIRGQHIHKLRCDEIELFEPEVFAAAKFTTQSSDDITAAMELISTMHKPYGLMNNAVNEAKKLAAPVFKWCVWETIEKCRDRTCSQCPLNDDCQGKAKKSAGYLKIDDCVTQMKRASRAGWEAEMLCRKPNLENVVFDQFDTEIHIAPLEYNPNIPLYRTLDFGFVNPFVCLWIQVDNSGQVRVIDEYQRSRATINVHAENLLKITPCPEEQVAATYCDPAGAAANDVTGTSSVRTLAATGIKTKYRKSRILEGIELIRRAIKAGDGTSKFLINPKCVRLIEAMRCYHYPDKHNDAAELPDKDGVYDHHIDALRYFFINYNRQGKLLSRRY